MQPCIALRSPLTPAHSVLSQPIKVPAKLKGPALFAAFSSGGSPGGAEEEKSIDLPQKLMDAMQTDEAAQ